MLIVTIDTLSLNFDYYWFVTLEIIFNALFTLKWRSNDVMQAVVTHCNVGTVQLSTVAPPALHSPVASIDLGIGW